MHCSQVGLHNGFFSRDPLPFSSLCKGFDRIRVQWQSAVNRAHRAAGSTVTGGVSQAAAEAYAANKKSKLAADFYRFQSREQKRNELVELQHQFAAAKKQVFALRTSRKFQG